MTSQQKRKLKELILNRKTDRALAVLDSIDTTPTRTDNQNAAYWVWLTQIEREAENAGITFDQVVGHTHQLRVTKENVHELVKQLMKALWGTTSTRELKKVGQIEIIEQHLADLFSKVGLELPPFPSREQENNELLSAIELSKKIHDTNREESV